MDYIRQLGLINPKNIKNKSVSVIGVGATGSHVALYLSQLGWGNTAQEQGVLKAFDDDIIEEHNLCNQIYEPAHVGKPKVVALNEIIKRKCNFEIETHKEIVTDQKSVQSTYVFILTDTMASRKEIFDKCLKFSFNTDLVIETRMGLRDGRVYAFNPHDGDQVEEWKKTLYSDEEANVSACGASASIITTTTFLASLACGRLLEHFERKYGTDEKDTKANQSKMWNEVHFSLYPESFYYRTFDGAEPQYIVQQN